MDPMDPLHHLALSLFTSISKWGTHARAHVTVKLFDFMAQPLYLSVLPVFVSSLVFCVLWKSVHSGKPEILASRTVTISEVDDLMLKLSCGCDCGEVTRISNVAVAPSPELSFEPSQQPQLMLDSCASVSQIFCFCSILIRSLCLALMLCCAIYLAFLTCALVAAAACPRCLLHARVFGQEPPPRAKAHFRPRLSVRIAAFCDNATPSLIQLRLVSLFFACSFVPASLKNNLAWFTVLDASDITPASAIAELARKALLGFNKLTSCTPERLKNNACHLLLLPGIGESGVAERVDAVQVQLQPLAVSLGLMIGEFHKSNNASGLHNSNFYPLRMPFPALAIRHMVPGDWVFLKNEKKFAVPIVAQLMRDFIRHMGVRPGAKKEVEAAKQALADKERVQC